MIEAIIQAFVLLVLTTVAIGLLMLFTAFVLMLCWNGVVPEVFGLHSLTWGQSWCLLMGAYLLIHTNITIQKE